MSNNLDPGKLKIGITIGDVNGIGIEVILKTLQDSRILSLCTPIIYGSSKAISYHKKALNIDNINFNIVKKAEQAKPKTVNVYNCWDEELPISLGQPSDVGGEYAYISLDYAANELGEGSIQALVTAPINKHSIQSSQSSFIGHTEFLTQLYGAEDSLMMMINDQMKVGLVTNHVPVKDVSNKIKESRITSKLGLFDQSLKQDFGINAPKIAVLGLNPHAGDKGIIGKEEEEEILPAIIAAKEQGIMAIGPFSADGFFGTSDFKMFDGILSMYHDQGLGPFKALSFGNGINYTAGLPHVRTSPDHGTAFDIAGKNQSIRVFIPSGHICRY